MKRILTIALAAIADAWAPAVFSRVVEPLGVPTVDLTIHFRDRPTGEPGWTFARFRSQHAAAGYVEEDGELWSAGKSSRCTAATAGELQIDLDATKRTAAFRQQGRLLGEVTGLPSAVKLVVSLRWEDQFVTLL